MAVELYLDGLHVRLGVFFRVVAVNLEGTFHQKVLTLGGMLSVVSGWSFTGL